MTTAHFKAKNRKAVIFFDCHYSNIDPLTPSNIENCCKQLNIEIIDIIYKYKKADSINFEMLLHKIKQNNESLIVVIGKDTYNLPDNLISCVILGTLTRLKLIEIYVCRETFKKGDNQGSITLVPYDNANINLIAIAISHLELIIKNHQQQQS